MRFPRPSRFFAVLLALVGMLFMQLAVASYVCPGMQADSGGSPFAMAECEGMDTTQAGLCHSLAYDQAGKQFLDKPDLPSVQPFVPVELVLVRDAIEVAAQPLAAPPQSFLLTRTTPPPIAIRHCCLRL